MRRKKRSIWPVLRGSATAIEDGFVTYQITSRTGEKAAVQSAQAPVNPSDRLRCKPGTPSLGQLCLVMPARQLYDPGIEIWPTTGLLRLTVHRH
jgi:hypothetical protein